MKIGFFGGTFNPIHFGHLHIANEMIEKQNLEEVWFCPTQINPFKIEQDQTPSKHRLNMVSLAIEDYPRFKLCDLEIKKKGLSFTVDTLNELKKEDAKNQFYLILGDDIAGKFLEWKSPDKIVDMVSLLIGSRSGIDLSLFEKTPKIHEAIKKGIVETRRIDISSTQVRDRLHRGLPCENLVPAKVLEYIALNGLYLKKL